MQPEADAAGGISDEEIFGDLDQDSLYCDGLTEIMVGHVLLQLCGNCSLQGLTQERKVGDLPVVVEFNIISMTNSYFVAASG